MERYDKAAKAYIDIQLGKLLIIIHDLKNQIKKTIKDPKEREELILKINEDLFLTKKSKSRRFDLRNVASIQNVDKYYFLGIELLIDVSRVVKEVKSNNPIEEILIESGFNYENLEDIDESKVSDKLKIGVNKIKFNKHNINIPTSILNSITKSQGIISDDKIKKLSNAMKKGTSLLDSVNSYFFKKTKESYSSDQVDVSPSWNRMEETCLQLMDMIEDRLDDNKNLPTYDPERTVKMFKTLLYMVNTLNAHWSETWDNWSEIWESYDGEVE